MSSKSTPKPQFLQEPGALLKVLERAFPTLRAKQGGFNAPALAFALGYSHETIYRAIRSNELKTSVAHQMLIYARENHPEARLTWWQLMPFVLPDFYEFAEEPETSAEDDEFLGIV